MQATLADSFLADLEELSDNEDDVLVSIIPDVASVLLCPTYKF